MTTSDQNCGQTLRYHVIYNNQGLDIDVQSDSAQGIELRRIVKEFVKCVDKGIKKNRLNFELWVDSDQKFVSITTPKRLIANESVIRVSAKTGNSFNCFAELLVDNEKKFESEVVIEKYFKEKQKYLKVLSFLSDKCVKALGKRLKDFSQRKIEIFEQKTNRFVKLSRKSCDIPNGCRIRVNCCDIKSKRKAIKSRPELKIDGLDQHFRVLSIKEEQQKTTNDNYSDEPLMSSLKRLKIGIEETPNDDNKDNNDKDSEPKESPKKSRKKTKSKKKCKQRKSQKLRPNYNMNEEIVEYYLSQSLNQCLSQCSDADNSSNDLWQRVSDKVVNDCGIRSMNAFQCQMTFNEVFVKYLNVLGSASNPFEASLRLKSFDLLNGTDLKLVLTEANHCLVNQLKKKIWNGLKASESPSISQ